MRVTRLLYGWLSGRVCHASKLKVRLAPSVSYIDQFIYENYGQILSLENDVLNVHIPTGSGEPISLYDPDSFQKIFKRLQHLEKVTKSVATKGLENLLKDG